MNDVFSAAVTVLPDRIKIPVINAFDGLSDVYEIRFIRALSVYFYTSEGVRFVSSDGKAERKYPLNALCPTENELEEIVNRAMGYSGFLYDKELKEGFITYSKGCRMGISTSGGGKSFGLGNIHSLVIRLPYLTDITDEASLDKILPESHKGILVAGAPGSGKTTILRGIARRLSDGYLGEYKKVTVIDERGELAAGRSLGVCTDVIKGKNKSQAVLHALRLLSPQYIICDEIGGIGEARAITYGLNSGVSFVASIHAADINELIYRYQFRLLFAENVFGTVVFLSSDSPGKIRKIYSREEIQDEINRSHNNVCFSNSAAFLYGGSS